MTTQTIDIYSEVFGDLAAPTFLLNAGAGCQCTQWSATFCEALASKGYSVIRYDYRDTGKSTAIDYEQTPYHALDLATDAHNVLKKYRKSAAHWVGFSMGGQISMVAAHHFPEAVLSLTLIGTSTDFKPGFDALNQQTIEGDLPPPIPTYVDWAIQEIDIDTMTLDEKVKHCVATHEQLNNHTVLFNADYFEKLAKEEYTRTQLHLPFLNHAESMQRSFDLHREAAHQITQPTLILHGTHDPVFPIAHAHALKQAIPHATLRMHEALSHALQPSTFEILVEEIHAGVVGCL